METVIKIENLYKEYRLGTIGYGTLREDMQSWWARVRGKLDPNSIIGVEDGKTKKLDRILALNNINLEIKQGERLGIIGNNGAGKTTLLKILSRISSPTKGMAKIKGQVASLIAVGTGFHGELTGRENIYLNGSILGLRKFEIDQRFDEIVNFSGVEQFIDTPVKRYSSGMTIRLGFAVAAHLDPDVLIVDEVLTVGDFEFQQKAIGKMKDVSKGEGRTVLFVSHNMQAIINLCDSAILLDSGSVKLIGPSNKIVDAYLNNSESQDKSIVSPVYKKNDNNKSIAEITSIKIKDTNGEIQHSFNRSESIEIELELITREKLFQSYFGVLILCKNQNIAILGRDLEIENDFFGIREIGHYFCKMTIPAQSLAPGQYSITTDFTDNFKRYHRLENICWFEIIDHDSLRAIKDFSWPSSSGVLPKWEIKYEK